MRILKINISGIKNVDQGTVFFDELKQFEKKDFSMSKSNICAIYGQNGTGKSALVDVFVFLQTLARERKINSIDSFKTLISRIKKECNISLDLHYYDEKNDCHYKIVYKINAKINDSDFIPEITNETISCSLYNKKLNRFVVYFPPINIVYDIQPSADNSNLLSLSKSLSLDNIAKGFPNENANHNMQAIIVSLLTMIGTCKNLRQSFLFNSKFFEYFKENQNIMVKRFIKICCELKKYFSNLFIYLDITDATSNLGLSTFIGCGIDEETGITGSGSLIAMTNGPFEIPTNLMNHYKSFVKQIDVLLPTFVPDFKLSLETNGSKSFKNGKEMQTVELIRTIKNTKIPLSAESNGIKKFINLCSALIETYSNSDRCLIVDELDSGVFEFLLGQLLEAFNESAKGQLIFTSHNLRPLEILNKESIFVTTTNENERYIKLINVKPSNNLRDFYIRALQVGGQKQDVYSKTETSKIASAFRQGHKILSEKVN